ncbi:MAG: hypothetical protein H7259_09580 [Cytophagales bacterium]|nr:hypothetical protein [Cytophaga sp.]
MRGYIEIKKTSKGDVITIYLEPVPGTWYYITYDENRLAMASSIEEVNTAIASKTKGEMPDRSKFFMVKAEGMEVNKFVNSYRERYNITADVVEEAPVNEGVQDTTSQNRKTIQLNDTDNTQQRVQQEGGQNNNYQDGGTNSEQYKIQEQNTNYNTTDPNSTTNKPKPTIEQQQQLQQDQEQLKNLFK